MLLGTAEPSLGVVTDVAEILGVPRDRLLTQLSKDNTTFDNELTPHGGGKDKSFWWRDRLQELNLYKARAVLAGL